MATHQIVCHGCATKFTAKSAAAKWCSKTCRQRNARAQASAKAAAEAPEHALVVRVRKELAAKGVSDDVDGLLAVHLALAIASAESSGKTGPVAAFREARARALGLIEKPTPGTTEESEPEPSGQDAALALVLTMRDEIRAEIAAG